MLRGSWHRDETMSASSGLYLHFLICCKGVILRFASIKSGNNMISQFFWDCPCQECTGSRDVGWLARKVGCDKGGLLEWLMIK